MDSNKDDTSVFGMSILDIQKQEKEKERKHKQREQMRKYRSKPGFKEREYLQRHAKRLTKAISKLGKNNPHMICKKLGYSRARLRKDPSCFYRCTKCNVSYSEKQKNRFYLGIRCPCCHTQLRTRKTITAKRQGSV